MNDPVYMERISCLIYSNHGITQQQYAASTAFDEDLDCSYRGSTGNSTSGALSQDMEAQYHQKHQEPQLWTRTADVVSMQGWRGTMQGGTCARTSAHAHPVNVLMHVRMGVSTCV
eukprot:1142675-Pelagomonas_calceolata.AAC.6